MNNFLPFMWHTRPDKYVQYLKQLNIQKGRFVFDRMQSSDGAEAKEMEMSGRR